MPQITTLGSSTTTKIVMEESYCLAISFTAASDLASGQVVKMKTDGTVDKIAAVTDMPFGVVTNPAKTGEKATIMVPFVAVVNAVAQTDCNTYGVEASVATYDTVAKTDKYSPSVATNWVSGIILKTGTATNPITVGMLRQPYKKA